MKTAKILMALVLTGGLSACASVDTVARNAPFETPIETAIPAPTYQVAEVEVTVPDNLRVSEANMFYPIADIVWRGDVYGNRHEQVKALFETALARTPAAPGAVPAKVNIEVVRFHALTEKTRLVTGGVYSITYRLTLTDPATGQVLEPTRIVKDDFPSPKPYEFIALEQRGIKEKDVVLQNMTRKFAQHFGGQPA